MSSMTGFDSIQPSKIHTLEQNDPAAGVDSRIDSIPTTNPDSLFPTPLPTIVEPNTPQQSTSIEDDPEFQELLELIRKEETDEGVEASDGQKMTPEEKAKALMEMFSALRNTAPQAKFNPDVLEDFSPWGQMMNFMVKGFLPIAAGMAAVGYGTSALTSIINSSVSVGVPTAIGAATAFGAGYLTLKGAVNLTKSVASLVNDTASVSYEIEKALVTGSLNVASVGYEAIKNLPSNIQSGISSTACALRDMPANIYSLGLKGTFAKGIDVTKNIALGTLSNGLKAIGFGLRPVYRAGVRALPVALNAISFVIPAAISAVGFDFLLGLKISQLSTLTAGLAFASDAVAWPIISVSALILSLVSISAGYEFSNKVRNKMSGFTANLANYWHYSSMHEDITSLDDKGYIKKFNEASVALVSLVAELSDQSTLDNENKQKLIEKFEASLPVNIDSLRAINPSNPEQVLAPTIARILVDGPKLEESIKQYEKLIAANETKKAMEYLNDTLREQVYKFVYYRMLMSNPNRIQLGQFTEEVLSMRRQNMQKPRSTYLSNVSALVGQKVELPFNATAPLQVIEEALNYFRAEDQMQQEALMQDQLKQMQPSQD